LSNRIVYILFLSGLWITTVCFAGDDIIDLYGGLNLTAEKTSERTKPVVVALKHASKTPSSSPIALLAPKPSPAVHNDFQRGLELYLRGDYDSSIQSLQRYLEHNPGHAYTLQWLTIIKELKPQKALHEGVNNKTHRMESPLDRAQVFHPKKPTRQMESQYNKDLRQLQQDYDKSQEEVTRLSSITKDWEGSQRKTTARIKSLESQINRSNKQKDSLASYYEKAERARLESEKDSSRFKNKNRDLRKELGEAKIALENLSKNNRMLDTALRNSERRLITAMKNNEALNEKISGSELTLRKMSKGFELLYHKKADADQELALLKHKNERLFERFKKETKSLLD